jgi:hypothetical protein
MTTSEGTGRGRTAPALHVVEVVRRGPGRQRQVRELAASSSSAHVEVRWPAVSWLDAVLFTTALLAGTYCPELGPEDEQTCFEEYARALAPSGASWNWVHV